MTELAKEIEELVSLRRRYELKREMLYDKVKKLFNPEFERIKIEIPRGYKIESFDVVDGTVSIPNPCFRGEIVSDRQLDYLNAIFNDWFLRINVKYGFVVRFEQVSCIG